AARLRAVRRDGAHRPARAGRVLRPRRKDAGQGGDLSRRAGAEPGPFRQIPGEGSPGAPRATESEGGFGSKGRREEQGRGRKARQARGEEERGGALQAGYRDRKSTRLNSSHLVISYAVFCLKKKK